MGEYLRLVEQTLKEKRVPSPGVEEDAQRAKHVITVIADPEAGEQVRRHLMKRERDRLKKLDDLEAGEYHDVPKKNRAGGGSKKVKVEETEG